MSLTAFLNKYKNVFTEDLSFQNGSECHRCGLPYNIERDCQDKCHFDEELEYYFSEAENYLEDELTREYWQRKVNKILGKPHFVFSKELEKITESSINSIQDIDVVEEIKIFHTKKIKLSINFMCDYSYADGFIFTDIKFIHIESSNDKDKTGDLIRQTLDLFKEVSDEFLINTLEENNCLCKKKMLLELK